MHSNNNEDPPQETTSSPSPSPSPSSLPYDVVLSCVARVPRRYHPNLSLVSRSFRSLLASPELHATRALLGRAELCLYVSLRIPPDQTRKWFALNERPDTGRRLLVPLSPSSHPLPAVGSAPAVALGPEIYVIGGPVDDGWPSTSVSVLDCRYRTWRRAPNTMVSRKYAAAAVADGKIYVMGGVGEASDANWGEAFDPEMQTWEPLPSPDSELRRENRIICKSAVMEEKVYVTTLGSGLVYDPMIGRWSEMEKAAEWGWRGGATWCVIENLLYCYNNSKFVWYDSEESVWGEVKGLEELPKFCGYGLVAVVNYGGNLAVLWDSASGDHTKKLWCAEVTLERRRGGREVWGRVERSDVVLMVPKVYEFFDCLSVTL